MARLGNHCLATGGQRNVVRRPWPRLAKPPDLGAALLAARLACWKAGETAFDGSGKAKREMTDKSRTECSRHRIFGQRCNEKANSRQNDTGERSLSI